MDKLKNPLYGLMGVQQSITAEDDQESYISKNSVQTGRGGASASIQQVYGPFNSTRINLASRKTNNRNQTVGQGLIGSESVSTIVTLKKGLDKRTPSAYSGFGGESDHRSR